VWTRSLLACAAMTIGLSLYRRGVLRPAGEVARRISDVPLNRLRIATSGFEREGRDPAKAGEGASEHAAA
jgi:hypothetical protein